MPARGCGRRLFRGFGEQVARRWGAGAAPGIATQHTYWPMERSGISHKRCETFEKNLRSDLSSFPQSSSLRVRPVPAVLFEVLGPGGRGRHARLDHRVPVGAVTDATANAATVIGVGVGDRGVGRGADGAAVAVGVGYDYGVGGTVGSVAVGPPKQSQHNIRPKTGLTELHR